STGFTPGGILVPAESADDEGRIADAFATARQLGLATRLLNKAEIRDLIPQLAGNWRSGLYTPGDAHGEPALSTHTIARAAREAGAKIHENCPAVAVEMQGGKISGVVTAHGRCAAPLVVLAGGITTPALAKTVDVDLPIQVA